VVPWICPRVWFVESDEVEIEFPANLLRHLVAPLVLSIRLQHELHRVAPAGTAREKGDFINFMTGQ
jgi:hypothetical protein